MKKLLVTSILTIFLISSFTGSVYAYTTSTSASASQGIVNYNFYATIYYSYYNSSYWYISQVYTRYSGSLAIGGYIWARANGTNSNQTSIGYGVTGYNLYPKRISKRGYVVGAIWRWAIWGTYWQTRQDTWVTKAL